MQAPDDYASPVAPSELPPFLTVPEAAGRLGISSSNAYRLIQRGDFPVEVVRIGNLLRVRRTQLDRYLVGEAG